MRKELSLHAHRGFVSNVASLYGVQIAKYLFPLATVPYLTRVLGASGWGLLALTQGYAAYLALPVDYGFNYSGTRDVARFRDDSGQLSSIFAAVTGAKCLLAAGCIIVSFGFCQWIPVFREHPLLLWMGVLVALVPGFVPIWYFVGLERLKLVAGLDIIARALGTAGVFLVVRNRGDAWKALASWGVAGAVVAIVGTSLAYRNLSFRLPSWSEVWRTLREGRSMFASRAGMGLYASGNAFILSFFATAPVVGYYAGGEKIVRAALQLLQPPNRALFPKMSGLVARAPVRAAALARKSAAGLAGMGVVGLLLIFVCAPWLVRIVLGAGYGPAIPITRLLTVLLPLVALSISMGPLWMVPHAMDKPFERITVVAGMVNILLALALAGPYRATGVAAAAVFAEFFVTAAMFAYLARKKRGFWRTSPAE